MTPEQQVEKLERQLRRLLRIGSTVLVTVLSVVALCAGLLVTNRARAQSGPQPDVVTATEVRLVDAQGRARAVLAMEENEPRLRLYDEQGRVRASLGPNLVIAGADGKPGASLGVNEHASTLALGRDGNVRALLTVDEGAKPRLVFRDSTGKTSWSAPK